jgi:hypothetical protein
VESTILLSHPEGRYGVRFAQTLGLTVIVREYSLSLSFVSVILLFASTTILKVCEPADKGPVVKSVFSE